MHYFKSKMRIYLDRDADMWVIECHGKKHHRENITILVECRTIKKPAGSPHPRAYVSCVGYLVGDTITDKKPAMPNQPIFASLLSKVSTIGLPKPSFTA